MSLHNSHIEVGAEGSPSRVSSAWWLPLLASLLIGCGSEPSYAGIREEAEIWVGSTDLLSAEENRAGGAEAWAALGAGREDSDARIRARTARALGRLERTEAVSLLLPLLADDDPRVRAEAVNALGQAVWRVDPEIMVPDSSAAADGESGGAQPGPAGDATPTALDTVALIADSLTARAGLEADPWVRSVVAATLGRLPVASRERAEGIQRTLVEMAPDSLDSVAPLLATGIALGMDQLARRTPGPSILSRDAKSLLVRMFEFRGGPDGTSSDWARMRRAALSAYTFAGAPLDGEALRGALNDPDAQVRRLAVRVLGTAAGGPASWTARAVADSSAHVRIEALRTTAPAGPGRQCGLLIDALDDPDPHVATTAADLLGGPCEDPERQAQALLDVAGDLGDAWHVPAHALLSLARLGDVRAAAGTRRLAEHPNAFARAWAARAASELGIAAVLDNLAADSVANVRTEAIRGLVAVRGASALSTVVAQLEARDPQLVMTAAMLLNGVPGNSRWIPDLLDALDRMSEAGNETFRDVRIALLTALADAADRGSGRAGSGVGEVDLRERLGPYLRDYDPVVAERVAALLTDVQGTAVTASPRVVAQLPIPSARQLEALSGASVVLAMATGDTIRVRLLPGVAPINTFRFARLTRAGYFDGLTFHRVVPNFVIQGGSPGANEYWGDGPFSPDEVGLIHHWRGTVGLSTRGRDTGDAQIFVNLVDNLRLDFDYTIFGEVIEGMEGVDRVLEGDVIERAWVEPRTR